MVAYSLRTEIEDFSHCLSENLGSADYINIKYRYIYNSRQTTIVLEVKKKKLFITA